jgi:hypothetical protein
MNPGPVAIRRRREQATRGIIKWSGWVAGWLGNCDLEVKVFAKKPEVDPFAKIVPPKSFAAKHIVNTPGRINT